MIEDNAMENKMDHSYEKKSSGFGLFARKIYYNYLEESNSYGLGTITFNEFVKKNDGIITKKWNEYMKYSDECG
jgi:hypothetical protein